MLTTVLRLRALNFGGLKTPRFQAQVWGRGLQYLTSACVLYTVLGLRAFGFSSCFRQRLLVRFVGGVLLCDETVGPGLRVLELDLLNDCTGLMIKARASHFKICQKV